MFAFAVLLLQVPEPVLPAPISLLAPIALWEIVDLQALWGIYLTSLESFRITSRPFTRRRRSCAACAV